MTVIEESQTVSRIEFADGKKLTLVGSAHISEKSVEDVRTQFEDHAFDSVCIELDEDRWRRFHQAEDEAFRNFDLVKVIKSGKFFLMMVNLILSSFQKRLSADTTGSSGKEIIGAGNMARERGIPLHFVDRNISVTLKRAWAVSSMKSKANILATLFASAFDRSKITEEELESLKDRDNLDAMLAEMAKEMPSIKKVLIDERDEYLAKKIYSVAGNDKLAVVGQGHVAGLVKTLERLERGEAGGSGTEFLEVVPEKKGGGIAAWVLPGLIVAVLLGIGVAKGWQKGLEYFIVWAVCNAGSALLGAVLSLAHPVTWLVTALTAPVSALSPVLGVGMFAGVAEAVVRKAKVRDMEEVQDDMSRFSGWFKNRILHTFVIFTATSLASMLGTLVVFPALSGRMLVWLSGVFGI